MNENPRYSDEESLREQASRVLREFEAEPDPEAALRSAFRSAAASLAPDNRVRGLYVAEVEAMRPVAIERIEAGESIDSVARWAHGERRSLGVKYKALTPPPLDGLILARNLFRYDDPLGPTYEHLRSKGKTPAQIIESSLRTGGSDLGL